MSNIKLIIAYDGSFYLGWQKTKEGPSIEEEMEKALFQLLKKPVRLQATSRTDAGVHAFGQTINFFADEETIDLQKLNSLLPKSITVRDISIEKDGFHPTLDAQYKEYCYTIDNTAFQLPHRRYLAWHFIYPLDLGKMLTAKECLIGHHDFSAFTNRKEENNFCHLHSIDIVNDSGSFTITVRGHRFLYKMMRNIAGSLAYIGCNKRDNLAAILESKDRKQAGPAAPAHGLLLKKIYY